MARLMLQMLLLFTVASMTFASSAGTSQKVSTNFCFKRVLRILRNRAEGL